MIHPLRCQQMYSFRFSNHKSRFHRLYLLHIDHFRHKPVMTTVQERKGKCQACRLVGLVLKIVAWVEKGIDLPVCH